MTNNKRVALVTGGNRGIGLEVCKQLGRKGLKIFLGSRDLSLGQKAAEQLRAEGLDVTSVQVDVSDDTSCDRVVELIRTQDIRLDVLVNNAGVLVDPRRHPPEQGVSSLLSTSIDVIRKSMEVNTYGAIRLIQRVVPLMTANGYGRIVNVSSGMGQLSDMNGGWPGYRISKVGLNAVTRIVADELQGKNILVNSACPGWVKTRMGGDEAERSPE
jgi:NAD(P)-dependent dehydrogenase (short-subunit alcohol dehydrogenase family)